MALEERNEMQVNLVHNFSSLKRGKSKPLIRLLEITRVDGLVGERFDKVTCHIEIITN